MTIGPNSQHTSRYSKLRYVRPLFIAFLLILLFSFVITTFNHNVFFARAGVSSYTPYAPSGPTNCYKGLEYEYIMETTEVGSFWKFDWDDGTYSEWLEVDEGDINVSATHQWNVFGEFHIRIKYKNDQNEMSSWSSPLTVRITEPADIDNDGWITIMEISYETDPDDPDDYPLDTDEDGTPDVSSIDGNYTGDTDDDNDGLSDIVELFIGSNPNSPNPAISETIQGVVCYIVDTDNDGAYDVLYNSQTDKTTKISVEDGVMYLDFDADGNWDHTYKNGVLKEYFPIPWLYIIGGVVIAVLIILFILFKTGKIYLYEEYVIEE